VSGEILTLKRKGQKSLYFEFSQHIKCDGDRLTTQKYKYIIWDPEKRVHLYRWDYHKRNNNSFGAHLHVNTVKDKHIPTGRTTIEDVVRFLIQELKVTAQNPDWDKVLLATQKIFNSKKTWI